MGPRRVCDSCRYPINSSFLKVSGLSGASLLSKFEKHTGYLIVTGIAMVAVDGAHIRYMVANQENLAYYSRRKRMNERRNVMKEREAAARLLVP
jgi:hypothetical protein